MTAPELERRGLVLDSRDHGESDLIVTLYCRDLGRLTCIAKGAKRSKIRFVNKLELFTDLQIHYRPAKGGGLGLLSNAELRDSFLPLRQDLALYNTASTIRELVLAASRELEGEDGLFTLIHWAFSDLSRRRQPLTTLALFLVRFLGQIGYRPNLTGCGHCGLASDSNPGWHFNHNRGELLCGHCDPEGAGRSPLALGTIRMLAKAQEQPMEQLSRLRPAPAMLEEALPLLHRYTSRLLQRELHSWRFLPGQGTQPGIQPQS